MNYTTSKVSGLGRLALLLSLTGALLATTSGTVIAQSTASAAANGLVGTWVTRVTLRDCATSAPLGSFNSLVTFHRGGTLSESTGSLGFAPGQRSSGHGTWSRQSGHTYGERIVALILFDTAPNLPGSPSFDPGLPVSPGFFAGWQTITHTERLSDADHKTSAGTNEFYTSDGVLYRSGCSTATGQRFE